MLGLLVLTHGRLAEELVESATTIVGSSHGLAAVSIGWDDDVDGARERISQAVHRLDEGDGVLVLTDMFGGTPTNLALSLLDNDRLEVVTGVNLAMLIKFTSLRAHDQLDEVARRIAEQGRDAIHVASALLQEPPAGDEAES